jgi:cell division transport system ATP-binding protein
VIKFENVSKSYSKGSPAVKDVSFEIDRGEFVFLIGASGSGKTTLIRLMVREEKPDEGTIWVAGKNLVTMPSWKVPHFRRNVGVIFQDFRLLPNKTVAQNVAFALQVIGKPNRFIATQVPQILRLVGLEDKMDRFPHQLSGGEQQRVAIARAFVNRPLILLADEPTGNLDPETSWGVMNLLERINRTGTAVVMATHDVGIVDSMRRRVIEIDDGRLSRDQVRGVYGLGV